MKITDEYSCVSKVSRRTALKFTLATAFSSYLSAAESRSAITGVNVIRVRNKQGQGRVDTLVEVAANLEVSGYGGPLLDHQAKNLEKLLPRIRKLLVGSESLQRTTDFEWIWNQLYPNNPLVAFANGLDPLTGKSHWNTRRKARHTPTGSIVTALSAVDNALWDLGLVEGLRTDLGEKAQLMFDFAVGGRGRKDWDVDYAVRVAKAIQPYKPTWLEEPFSPEEIDCYRRLRGETDISLATGEHTYSRWNIKPFLDEKLVSYVQSDPEWCGGISELLQVCKLVSKYENVRVIPHGHHVLAATQTVASQPESLCPMVEYGRSWVVPRQRCQTRVVEPEAGYVQTPNEPGLGPSIDWSRCERL
jgi:L-alanine-DL-glutamate epimerase-like enolase superfamily enzyme